MCKKLLTLVVVFLLSLSSVTSAQVPTGSAGDWAGLKAIAADSKLSVELKTGQTVKGRLRDVTDTALSLSVSNKPVDLNRADVLRVYQLRGKSATKATLIGLGVGAGVGAAVGVAGGDNHGLAPNSAQLGGGLAVLAGGAGALAGYLIGRGGHKRVLIYETGQP